ncbi:MAG: hypothetical protein IKG18_11910 [Atopobiaceae bacterium]|nr:hypothetical protein [Atopobiaceae bacterium]
MLNSYRDSTRQYDNLIDEYNNNCELLDREMEALAQARTRAQSTLVATQDLVNSIAKTPRTIAKELRELKAQVSKIPHTTSEYDKLQKKIRTANAAAGAVAAGGAMFALSKKGRELIGNIMKSKIPLLAKVAAAILLVLIFLIPFIISKIGTKKTLDKIRKLEQENQQVMRLTEACRARIREIDVLESGLSQQLEQLRHLANSNYKQLDREARDGLGALVNSALALAKKANEELA